MFILILYIYAGAWAKGDSVTLNSIRGFSTMAECKAAGTASANLVEGSTKNLRFVCVEQKDGK